VLPPSAPIIGRAAPLIYAFVSAYVEPDCVPLIYNLVDPLALTTAICCHVLSVGDAPVIRSAKLYINGTQSGSTYADTNAYINGAARPIIGADGGNTATQNYAGYIDELRVTKGYARYTANFTPSGPFPDY